MQKQDEQNRKRKGLIITAVVHVAIVVLFCLFGFEIIDPKPGGLTAEWEVEGVENAGGEKMDDPSSENPNNTNQTPQNTSASQQSAAEEEELISDASSDVSVKSTPQTKPKPKPKDVVVKDNPKANEQKADPSPSPDDALKRLLGGMNKGDNKSGGKGDGDNPGVEGDPNGGGNDKQGQGGIGKGRYDIGGRTAVNIGSHSNSCGETGKVKVWVKINRAGQVVSALDRSGTTQNDCLIKLAIKQAKSIQYAPTQGGAPFNEGIVVMDFGLQ